jgi:hypothetical protein
MSVAERESLLVTAHHMLRHIDGPQGYNNRPGVVEICNLDELGGLGEIGREELQ